MFNNQAAVQNAPADAIAFAASEARVAFIRKTYTHLLGAIGVFVALCTVFVNSPVADAMINLVSMRFGGLIMFVLFIGASTVANKWALTSVDPKKAYLGLGLYIVAMALFITPLLLLATLMEATSGQPILLNAAILTLGAFTAMTAIVFFTGKDFSFLGSLLKVAVMVAFGVIACSYLFGFSIGILGCGAMALLSCGIILYETSNVMHRYRTGMHVAASLALFAAIALLFLYILQIVMSLTGRD